ncbi:MAG TPA: hypothetical protein VLA97_18180 [Nocardioidaceae bacterium]|nr:hypothetical protein [Nocardioidaceae bacterium]
MLVLGIILVLVASLALIAALTGGSTQEVVFSLGIIEVTTTPMIVFLIGAATVLVFVMGLELIRSGLRRASKRRRERKELNRLSQQLEARETEKATGTGDTTTATTTDATMTGPADTTTTDQPATTKQQPTTAEDTTVDRPSHRAE